MRVLWFTTGPMPAVNRHAGLPVGGSGYWMSSLLEHLIDTPGLQLSVATAHPGLRDDFFRDEGVDYYVIGQPRFHSIFRCRQRDLARAVEIVRTVAPDIVHVHGTERFYGLMPARRLIRPPAVISIQGLLEPYLDGFFGALSWAEVWRCERLLELATRRGLLWQYREFNRGSRQEREIIQGAGAFMGRTDWDRAHVRRWNSRAAYFHVDEILRRPFRETRWNLAKCDPHTIIFTNAGEPRRGTEVILKALSLLRREFPAARLRLAGHVGERRGYHRFLRKMIAEAGLAPAVEFLGYLRAEDMARELSRAHAFVISSYVENSPNSLCEAMQVGLPCVATYTGGIPSLVEHGRTGLLTPVGDAPLLADAVGRIFRDADLAVHLGEAARAVALERHAPQRVIGQLLAAYSRVAAGDSPPEPADGELIRSFPAGKEL